MFHASSVSVGLRAVLALLKIQGCFGQHNHTTYAWNAHKGDVSKFHETLKATSQKSQVNFDKLGKAANLYSLIFHPNYALMDNMDGEYLSRRVIGILDGDDDNYCSFKSAQKREVISRSNATNHFYKDHEPMKGKKTMEAQKVLLESHGWLFY